MMNRWMRAALLSLLAVAPLALFVGCNDSDGGGSPTVNVTGFWEGRCNAGTTFALNITQDGSGNVTGEAGTGGARGPVTGDVSGNTFTFEIAVLGETGKATVEGNTMNVVATPDRFSVVLKKK